MDRYVIRGGRQGAARLRVLSRFWVGSTEALFDAVQVRPGSRCLDLGCGAGDVTAQLARRVGPTGLAVGIDMDVDKLAAAAEHAHELGVSEQTQFLEGNVNDFAVEPANDVVYCRFVLEHLTHPVEVLRRMWKAVVPGGVVVVEDADFDAQFCYPPDPAFDFWVQRYPALLREAGGDPQIGQKLPALFTEAGIPDPQISIVQQAHLTVEGKTLPVLTLDATASAMRAAHVATEGEIDQALQRMRELAADPNVLFGSPRMCQVWARRPHA